MQTSAYNGILSRPSTHTVDETVARIKAVLEAKGVFAVIDHDGEAAASSFILSSAAALRALCPTPAFISLQTAPCLCARIESTLQESFAPLRLRR